MRRFMAVCCLLILVLLTPNSVSAASLGIDLSSSSDSYLLELHTQISDELRARNVYPFLDLALNDRSDDVTALQRRLKQLGHYSGDPSGRYDANTVQAMKSYEKAAGWKMDGKASINEQKTIFSSMAVSKPTPTPKPTRRPTATPRPTATRRPTSTPQPEPRYPLVDTGSGNSGTSYGYKWFQNKYKNTSKSYTIDGFTIAYYATDVYGNRIKAHGFGEEVQYQIITRTVRPGQTTTLDRITAYGFEDAKQIHTAVVKIHFTDGRTIDVPESAQEYWYWEY